MNYNERWMVEGGDRLPAHLQRWTNRRRTMTMTYDLNGYKVATFTDFNQPGRRAVIGRHKTFGTAATQYKRIWNIYHRLHGYRVWQEVITDTTTQTR